MAEALGDAAEAARLSALQDSFSEDVRESLAATIARHQIDFVPGSVEFGDFDPTATSVAIGLLDQLHLLPETETHRTFDKYLAGFRERASGTVNWNNYSAYEIRIIGALVKLGRNDSTVVALDADVMNSTMTEGFFREFPERSFQNFIAEQNMAGMAVGLSALGYKPFVATFASFLTRAHDVIRMAQYSTSNITFAGSHAGISIGPDGPSQMGLEDIPMFLSMPEALVLYPSDAVSAERLVDAAARHTGISYLRLTRDKTPVLYDNSDTFPAGGLKVLRKDDRDRVLIIAAGITVHEALKAHERAKERGIHTRIIDLYSIKPLDRDALASHAQACHGNVIVVEDHYCGAIADRVSAAVGKLCSLCVKEIPRSGQREELLALYGIDATAIVAAVEKILQVC
jgi:transketolase